MPEFPSEPIPSARFVEEIVPAFFAEVELDDAQRAVDFQLGVVLHGDSEGAASPDPGGEWTLRFANGTLEIARDRAEACEVSIVQRVADWRAALWEGRPALIAEPLAKALREGADAFGPTSGEGPASPTELAGFSDIQGLIEIVIADPEASDWALGIRVGAGPIPDEPQATIRLGAEQAEAIRTGALHPLEALMSGELRLEGDLGLILQLQAVAMTASMAAGGRGTG